MKACQSINRGEFPADNEEFQFIERSDEEKFDYLDAALSAVNDLPDALQIVTTSNAERHLVNEWCRTRKGLAKDQVHVGERVCSNHNDYKTAALYEWYALKGSHGCVSASGRSDAAAAPVNEIEKGA